MRDRGANRWGILSLVVGASLFLVPEWLHAGQKEPWRVHARSIQESNPRYARVLASIVPTTILVYWPQDEDTPEEDRWSLDSEEILEDAGHRVEIALDPDSFSRAAESHDFEVVVMLIDQARVLGDDFNRLFPGAALLPVSHLASRRELSAAREQFDMVLKMPSTADRVLLAIEEARASRQQPRNPGIPKRPSEP